jgi:hypothetical protein
MLGEVGSSLKILIKEGRNKQANVERKKVQHTDNMAMTRKESRTNKVIVQGHASSTPA